MRHDGPFSPHTIAYEIDAGHLDGAACDCPLCRPHGSLFAFLSRDHLTLNGRDGRPSNRFNRQRLSHRFCSIEQGQNASTGINPGDARLKVSQS